MTLLFILSSIGLLLYLKRSDVSSVLSNRHSQLTSYVRMRASHQRVKKLNSKPCTEGGRHHDYGDWTEELLGIKARWCKHCTSEETVSATMKVPNVEEGAH